MVGHTKMRELCEVRAEMRDTKSQRIHRQKSPGYRMYHILTSDSPLGAINSAGGPSPEIKPRRTHFVEARLRVLVLALVCPP